MSNIINSTQITNKGVNRTYFFIILISGILSLNFFSIDEVWVRYGNKVTIIDQEDAYTISVFLILYYFIAFIEKKEFKNLMLFFIVLIQNIICVYKTNLIIIPSMIMIYFLLFYKNKRIRNLRFIISLMFFLFIVILILIKYDYINLLITSIAIKTRIVQIKSFFDNLDNNYKFLFGLGHGTPYMSLEDTEDYGEIKLIDKIYNGFKFDVQIPIVSIIKSAGFIGLLVFIFFSFLIISIVIKKYKEKLYIEPVYKAFVIYFIFNIFLSTNFISGNPAEVMFSAYIISNVINGMKSR